MIPRLSKRLRLLGVTLFVLALTAAMVTQVLAGTVLINSGFEGDDGNLVVNAPATQLDWNGFDPTTWTGTAPNRLSSKTHDAWQFTGIEDAQATTSDTAFAGGTKQDDNCPTVITAKAPNKDDMKRAYVAFKTDLASGKTYLELAWVRIPLNTTSSSAHIGFEFNQSSTACGAGSDGLVQRTPGDMLVVYDFEGGGATPVITLRRWVAAPGVCEVSSDNAPCWGPATNLTANNFAEAKVNVGVSVLDTIAPSDETLGNSEFGEAGIDLTGAGVFPPGVCAAFGKVYAVSRSSGNSGTAQMKDLVGPASINLSNCGEVTIIKKTVPEHLNQNFNFTSNLAGSQIICSQDTTPASFDLNDGGTNTEICTNVPVGSYIVTEGANPTGFVFQSLQCTASGTGTTASQDGTIPKQANIVMGANGEVHCTYTNVQQLGAIQINKTSTKGNSALPGAKFTITFGGNAISGSPFTSDANGSVCVDGLAFGDYVVTEFSAPSGYRIDDTSSHTVNVGGANSSCTSGAPANQTLAFSDTPLSKIQVVFTSLAGAGVTNASIVCTTGGNYVPPDPADPTPLATVFDDTNESIINLAPGTYVCTVVVDP